MATALPPGIRTKSPDTGTVPVDQVLALDQSPGDAVLEMAVMVFAKRELESSMLASESKNVFIQGQDLGIGCRKHNCCFRKFQQFIRKYT